MLIQRLDSDLGLFSHKMSIDVAALWHSHQIKLTKFLLSRVSNRDDMEDILQSTFLEAIKSLNRYRGNAKPETWLYGIAINLVKTHYRKSSRWVSMEDANMDEWSHTYLTEDPFHLVDFKMRLSRALESLSQMPEDTQRMIQQVVAHGDSYEKMAEDFAVPIGTVRSRLSRARQKVRDFADVDGLLGKAVIRNKRSNSTRPSRSRITRLQQRILN